MRCECYSNLDDIDKSNERNIDIYVMCRVDGHL